MIYCPSPQLAGLNWQNQKQILVIKRKLSNHKIGGQTAKPLKLESSVATSGSWTSAPPVRADKWEEKGWRIPNTKTQIATGIKPWFWNFQNLLLVLVSDSPSPKIGVLIESLQGFFCNCRSIFGFMGFEFACIWNYLRRDALLISWGVFLIFVSLW